jgi:putative acetyltransferase
LADRGGLRCVIRRESKGDRDAIRSLTARAFSGLSFSDGTEPAVIDALREAHALALSLVAVLDERIVGHVAFSEVGPPAQHGWFALGPVSVDPEFQRRGVGSQIIQAGLQALREQGAKGCVLLGDHRYYHRFGFVVASEFAPSQYPAEHFQIVRFGQAFPNAPVAFHPALSTEASEHAAPGRRTGRGAKSDEIEIVDYDPPIVRCGLNAS